MADIKQLVAFISCYEGGYVNDPSDSGGPTNRGVTLVTWQKKGYDKNGDGTIDEQDIARITHKEMVEVVLRPHFWNVWQADLIKNQSIANLLVDWLWTSGHRTIFLVQNILRVKADGVVGNQTLHALNSFPDQEILFSRIKTKRVNDIHRICKQHPKNMRFKRGWLNRIAAIKFAPVLILSVLLYSLTSCRTTGKNIAQEISIKSENKTEAQEMSADIHQSLSATLSRLTTELCIDSISETAVVAFKLVESADSAKQLVPVQVEGRAIITRKKKVLTAVHQYRQTAVNATRQDSSSRKSVTRQSIREQSAGIQQDAIENQAKPVLTMMMLALLAFWIYYAIRGRKFN